MNCPVCEHKMIEGEVLLRKNSMNFLIFGWGSTDLKFKHEDGTEETLLGKFDISKAYKCKKCGATTIAT